MDFKFTSRIARLGIALLSMFISMGVIVLVDHLPQQLKQDQLIVNHLCLLQLIASVLLFVGSIKHNQWYFVPWLLMAALFAYALVYKSIGYMLSTWNDAKFFLQIICLLYITSGFWCYFIYAVYQDFQDMRGKRRAGISTFGYEHVFEI